ncbi:MAG: hypothetical protein IJ089_04480 [Clostridia bacterium]|nr:hypothetical protein [Clostridia bacterium]
MANYTYDPGNIVDRTTDRARFELGDVMVDGGAETAYLSDDEIFMVIESEKSWKRALFRLADAVCMRLSYETDWKDDGTAFNLNQRAERWMKLRDRLKLEADAEGGLPESGAVRDSLRSADGGHYFRRGMNNSPFVQPPYLFGGDR